MRIAVLIPSRGRPFMLMEAVRSLRMRETGVNEVVYLIGCDSDDPATIGAAYRLSLESPNVRPVVSIRDGSLGAMVNALAAKVEADVYCSLCDDIHCLTQGWDAHIAFVWSHDPRGVWWWCSPSNTTFAIVSAKWREAAGYIFTPHFPYWFDDMWLLELWRLTTCESHRVITATVEDRGPSTHRMRDLDFWRDFFLSKRETRTAEGKRIASLLGYIPPSDPAKLWLAPSATFDAKATQARQGDNGPPTPEYMRVYRQAQQLMAA